MNCMYELHNSFLVLRMPWLLVGYMYDYPLLQKCLLDFQSGMAQTRLLGYRANAKKRAISNDKVTVLKADVNCKMMSVLVLDGVTSFYA